jgi:hypothetical protein
MPPDRPLPEADIRLVERWILLRHAVDSIGRKEFMIVQMAHQPVLLLLVEHFASHHLEYTHRVSQFLHPIGVHKKEPPVLGAPQCLLQKHLESLGSLQ